MENSLIEQLLKEQEIERENITNDMLELAEEMKNIHGDASQKINDDKEVCILLFFYFPIFLFLC